MIIDFLKSYFGEKRKIIVKNERIWIDNYRTSIVVGDSIIWKSKIYQWKLPTEDKFDLKVSGRSSDGISINVSVQNIHFWSEE